MGSGVFLWWLVGLQLRGIWFWTCDRVCVVCCAFLCVCVLLGVFVCLKNRKKFDN